jgi:multicomponent K+:H+ antiporter subunit D
MSHWIIAPIVLPALLAPLIAMVMRHDLPLARAASVAGTAALLAIAIGLAVTASAGRRSSTGSATGPRPSASCSCSTGCRRSWCS